MALRKPTMIGSMREMVEGYYAALADPAAHDWPRHVVETLCMMADTGTNRQDRYITLAACALNSLDVSDREAFTLDLEVSARVTARMADAPVWPDAEPPTGFATPSDADVALVKKRTISEVTRHAERQAAQFIDQGFRMNLTYWRKHAEATAYQTIVDEGGTPAASDAPHVFAEAAARGVSEADVVAEIMADYGAWIAINAQIEAARRKARFVIEAAPDLVAVAAAADTARAEIDAVIAAALGQ